MAKAITSRTESLTIRVPVDLMAELRAEAKASGTSVGSVFVGKVRAAATLAAEIVDLKKALAAQLTLAARPIPIPGWAPSTPTLSDSPTLNPKAAHPSGPVLADPRPQNIQGQATGYRPKGTWKDHRGKK